MPHWCLKFSTLAATHMSNVLFTLSWKTLVNTFQRHTTDIHDDNGKLILQSVTEQDALSEFISTAELANREFTAGNVIQQILPQ